MRLSVWKQRAGDRFWTGFMSHEVKLHTWELTSATQKISRNKLFIKIFELMLEHQIFGSRKNLLLPIDQMSTTLQPIYVPARTEYGWSEARQTWCWIPVTGWHILQRYDYAIPWKPQFIPMDTACGWKDFYTAKRAQTDREVKIDKNEFFPESKPKRIPG